MPWQDDARRHAEREAPREACGLVIERAGALVYAACRNVALRDDDFEIAAEDQVAAERLGEIRGLFHSHAGSCQPSGADLQMLSLGLPMHILGVDGWWSSEHA